MVRWGHNAEDIEIEFGPKGMSVLVHDRDGNSASAVIPPGRIYRFLDDLDDALEKAGEEYAEAWRGQKPKPRAQG